MEKAFASIYPSLKQECFYNFDSYFIYKFKIKKKFLLPCFQKETICPTSICICIYTILIVA